jgi:hypothetical protein
MLTDASWLCSLKLNKRQLIRSLKAEVQAGASGFWMIFPALLSAILRF